MSAAYLRFHAGPRKIGDQRCCLPAARENSVTIVRSLDTGNMKMALLLFLANYEALNGGLTLMANLVSAVI